MVASQPGNIQAVKCLKAKHQTVNEQQLEIGGDIILGVGDVPVPSIEDLAALLQQAQPGRTVTLQALRDGRLGDVDQAVWLVTVTARS
jgi:S1-C subfamily serine protease